eukprot:2590186-Amphidinium_carterae.1
MVLPLRQTGWGPRAAKYDVTIGNVKDSTTVTVAMAMQQDSAWQDRCCFAHRPWEGGLMHSTSPNGWTTTDCILQSCTSLTAGSAGQSTPAADLHSRSFRSWMCTVHTSVEMDLCLPHCWLCNSVLPSFGRGDLQEFQVLKRSALGAWTNAVFC